MNLNPASIARAQFFQRIKPNCVAIARLTIKSAPATGTSPDHGFKELTELIQQLLGRLEAQISIDPSVLDDKLAEYIFFPLGYALKNIETYPAALLEKVVRCLEILVVHGWKAEMAPDLAQQLLSFLSFVVDGAAAGQEKGRRDVPEETEIAAFSAIAALFNTIGPTPAGSAVLASLGAAPAISHSVAATLEGVTGGKSPESQLAALRAVDAVFKNVKDHATLASFLPGTVSALAKVLSTPGHHKRRVLAMSIDTLSHVLVCVLSDVKLRHIPAGAETDTGKEPGKGQVLTRSWVSATASQVKLAISAVLKLRNSNHAEIQKAQEHLCISLLDECHSSLASCAQILVDTAIILAPGEDKKGAVTSLVDLAAIYPELSDVAKTTVYNWMSSLPRMMQSGEEAVRTRAVRNLAKGIRIMSSLQVNSVMLRDMTAPVLRDSVIALMAGTQIRKPTLLDESTPAGSSLGPPAGGILTLSTEENDFDHVLVSGGGQAGAWDGLVDLLSSVGTPAQQAKLASELLELARESSGPEQASSLWISYQLVRLALGEDHEADAYLDLSALDSPSEVPESALGHLFSFAVALVDSHAAAMSDADWRTEAIALEVITFAASRLGQAFRLELIDVLYPISTFLGSGDPNLRTHAIVSLNLIARHCGYQAVSDLIVHNADYMINSVGLRLNTLDMPPESTQVLVMIVRLAGPKIVPFMDDIVASIFSALESYHGYPLFVEGLFSVLREIVEQGVKADPLLVEDRGTGHRKRAPSRATLESVAETLEKRRERDEERRKEADDIVEVGGERGHPEVPWGRASPPRGDGAEEPEAPPDETDEDNPPRAPTYQLMLKIADLTQHYLTSPAPRLRKCLLDLLDTAAPALGSREDQLLPLINTVWPVVVNRLYDPEPYVAIAACDAICALCSAAGDFLGSRLRTEWTDRLERWCRAVKDGQRSKAHRRRLGWEGGRDGTRESANGDRGDIIRIPGLEGSQPRADPLARPGQDGAGAGLGRFSQAAKGWDAVVRLLTAMASYVRVDDEMFDDMLELLVDELDGRPEVRQALETLNEDAVWLARYERGHVEWRPTPVLAGVSFPEMNKTAAAT